MKLEDQLTSLEPSKKLEKLGVKQDSLFWWIKYSANGKFWLKRGIKDERWNEGVSAFTVAELISRLGDKFGILERFKDNTYGAYIPNDCGVNGLGENPQEALANLLINTYEE